MQGIKVINLHSLFINEYNSVIPVADATVVGIANEENSKHIQKQKHLLTGKRVLFVFDIHKART